MADQFQNPQDQAQLNQLYAALTALDADVKAIQEQLAAETAAIREQQAVSRRGAPRSTASAVPILNEEIAAIDQQVVSYTKLNELIAQRIALEKEAATATSRTAAAATGGGAVRTAGWADPAERQRILGISGMGAAGAATASLGASGGAAAAAAASTTELAAAQEKAAATAAGLAAAELDSREAIVSAALAVQQLDNKLAVTGALSGAALTALGNGTITLRDLGHQVTETIGKFGGWTLAAAAVYGVLGSLNEVRKGAVDTSSTLQALTKFLPPGSLNQGAARQSLVQQAQETATPLNDVGDAAQQFAKVFKTQTDVFTATHVALTAAKLDNISLADSYKYLTAIVQETGQGAGALPHIFDQITAAQDRLGARVSQLLPAFSGSVGAVQTAHGDPNQLLGLEALTLVRTGRSGSQIGTAFSRGATNFFPTAASRGVLERHHIDPNQGFTQALIEAMQHSPELSSDARREVSQAFFGTRFGAQLAPLFRVHPDQLQHFLSATAPGAAPGLANQQLAKTIAQPNSQLELLKVNLQAIGAELTGSAFTSPFGLMLHGLNDALELTTKLMAAWDALPGPLKEAASYVALIGGGIALARRFNVGGILASSGSTALQTISPVFARNPQAILESQATAAMQGLQTTISSELQSASVRQMRSSLALAQAQDRLAAIEAEQGVESEAYTAALAEAAAAMAARDAAVADISFYQGLNTPESLAAMRASMLGREGQTAAGAAIPEGTLLAGGAGGLIGSTRGGAISQSLRNRASAYEATAAEDMTAFTGEVSVGAVMMGGLTGKVAAVSEGLSSLAAFAIPGAIAAFLAFSLVKSAIQSGQKAYDQGVNDIYNSKNPAAAARALQEARKSGANSWEPWTWGTAFGNLLNGNDAAAQSAYQNQMGYFHGLSTERRVGLRAFDQASTLENEGKFRQAYERMKTDNAFRALGTIQTPGPFGTNIGWNYQDELKKYQVAYEGNAVTGGKGVNPFAQWETAGQDLTNRLVPMLQGIGDAAKVFGSKSGNLGQLAAGYAYTVEKFGGNTGDVKAMQALAQAQSELVAGVDKQVTDLTNLAGMASTNKGQQGYYEQALAAVSSAQSKIRSMFSAAEKLPGADVGSLRQAEQQVLGLVAQRRQSAIDGLLQLAQSEAQLETSKITGVGPEADLQRAISTLSGLQTQLSTAKRIGADAQKIDALETQVNQQAVTILQDRINYYQQLAQAQISAAQGTTADPVQQEQIAITALQALYTKLKAAGADKVTLLNLSGQISGDILAQVSNQISAEQAGVQEWVSGANIGQPQQVQLQNNLTAAERELAYLQSLPANQVAPSAMANAITAVNQAKGAIAQWVIQQGQALIQAEVALQQASTFDPVQIAQDALAGAKRLLAYDISHNMPHAQIVQDRATVRADMKARLSAEWAKQGATIDYLASTYQITGAQEIVRLQRLYQAMKKAGASYSDLQGVLEKIWNLEYGGGNLNLNTGDIHLPSTYEVKSAIMRGNHVQRRKTAAGMVADVKTDVKMNVYVHRDADVRKVAKAISDALGTSVHGLTAAAGIMD